jgi:hypothetical protein
LAIALAFETAANDVSPTERSLFLHEPVPTRPLCAVIAFSRLPDFDLLADAGGRKAFMSLAHSWQREQKSTSTAIYRTTSSTPSSDGLKLSNVD